jgi:lipopolysaccharide export system protein LptA
MKIFQFNHRKAMRGIHLAAALLLILAAGRPSVRAAETTGGAPSEPIRITSDKLLIDNQANSADFTGNVKAVQGKTEVTADRLILYYHGSDQPDNGNRSDKIKKIHVQGHVRIVFDNRVAVGEQAVYTTDNRQLVLTGPNSQITSDNNVITGKEIIFDRNSGQVKVDNKGDGQVKAIIQSDQRGLN